MPDRSVGRFNGHKVGTTYEVVSDVLLLDSGAAGARLTIPSFDAKEKELALGASARKTEVSLPAGTQLKLKSVDRTGHKSWNTGTYYIHAVTVQIISGPFRPMNGMLFLLICTTFPSPLYPTTALPTYLPSLTYLYTHHSSYLPTYLSTYCYLCHFSFIRADNMHLCYA